MCGWWLAVVPKRPLLFTDYYFFARDETAGRRCLLSHRRLYETAEDEEIIVLL